MYNLDAYISDFLTEHKKLSVQGLGEFTVVNGQAPNGLPLVEFSPNKKTYTTEELVSFISENQGKNRIVTGFDIEAHLNQIKQFINIGTPWQIPGFGQLQLNKSRELEFVQQVSSEHLLHERSKSKQAANEANYQTYKLTNPEAGRTSNTGVIVLTLFIIIALGAGGYYFYANRNDTYTAVATKDTAATLTDTVVSVPSSSPINNTVTATQPPAASDGTSTTIATTPASTGVNGYHFILNKTVNPVYAIKRFNQLKLNGTKVYMDSAKHDTYSLYKIYLVKDAPASDTAKLKDSLTRYFGRPVTIERQ